MAVRAHLPDGRILNFPDGTPPSVVQATVKRLLAPAAQTRSAGEAIGDVGLSLGQGAIGAFKALSDVAGAENPVSQTLGAASKFLGSQKSEQSQATMQASQQRIREAEATGELGPEVKAYLDMIWDQPVEMLAQAAGSFATLGIGKAVQAVRLLSGAKAAGVSKAAFLATDAGKAAAKAAAQAGFRTNIGVGAGMGLGAVKGSQYDQTYQNARAQGMSDEQARALAAEAQAYGGEGTGQQVLGAGLGALASATGPIERLLVGRPGAAVGASLPSSVARGVAVEGGTEGAQGGQERYAGNVAAIDAGVLAPEARFRGVAGQSAQEGVLGGVLGGITGPMGRERPEAETRPATGTELQRELEDRLLADRQSDVDRRDRAAEDQALLASGDYAALEQRKQELLQNPTKQNKALVTQIKQVQAELNTQALAARQPNVTPPAPTAAFDRQLAQARGLPSTPEQSAFSETDPQQIEMGGMGRPGTLPMAPEVAPAAPTQDELEAAGQMALPLRRTAEGRPTTTPLPTQEPRSPIQGFLPGVGYSGGVAPPVESGPTAPTAKELEAAGQERLPLRRTPAGQPTTGAAQPTLDFGPEPTAPTEAIPEPTLRPKTAPVHPALTKDAVGGRVFNWSTSPKGREFVAAITAMQPEQVQNLREELAKNPNKDKNRQAIFNAIYPESTAGAGVRPEPEAGQPAAEPSMGVPVPSEPQSADTELAEPSDGAGVGAVSGPAGAESVPAGAPTAAVTPSPLAIDQLLRGGAQPEPTVEAEPETAAAPPPPAPKPRNAFDIPKRSVFDPIREAEDARQEQGGVIYRGDAYRTPEPQAAPAQPISAAELQTTVEQVTKSLDLPDGAGITVFDSITQVDPSQQAGSRAGMVTETGEIYLFRDGIAGGLEGQKTVFHELFHKGLRNLLPPAEYYRTMLKLYQQSAQVQSLADAWLADSQNQADVAALQSDQQRAVAVDEVLAGMAEQRKLPGTIRQIGNWMASIAARFGMPKLARSIRTMGMKPLETFIDDALRAAGPTPQTTTIAPAYRTAPFQPTTNFEQIVASSALLQDQPGFVQSSAKKVARAFETSAEVTAADRFRTLTVDNMATVERRINNLFDGAVRSARGILNPMGLNRQAQDVGKLLGDWFVDGVLARNPTTGTYETFRINGQPSMRDVLLRTQTWAQSKGYTLAQANSMISKMLEARRLDDMRKANAAGTGDFLINKLSNANPQSANAQIDVALAELRANPEVLAIAGDMDKIRAVLIDQLVQVGRLTPEQGTLWKDNIAYVPLDRVTEFEETFKNIRRTGGGIAQLGRLPTLKGSTKREVGDVMSNFTNMAGWMTHQIVQQDATATTLQMLEKMGYATKLKAKTRSANPELTVATFEAGRPVTYELPSRYDVLAFKDLGAPKGAVVKMLSGFSNLLRTTITSMPPFAVRQVIMDIQRAFVTSGVEKPYQLIAPAIRNFGAIAFSEIMGRRHPSVKKFGRLGMVGDFDINTFNPMESIMYDLGFKARGPLRGVIHRLQGITRASDLAVRIAVYDQTVKETGDALLAQTRARELINFRRRGSSEVVGAMTATIPFFNSYLQGMDVLYRAISGKGASASVGKAQARKVFASKAATMAAFATIYAILVSGTDEYDEMALRDRNSNWIIPGLNIKLPVPGELGALFKVPAELALEYMRRSGTAEDMAASEAAITALKYAYEQYIGGITPIPAAIKPVLEGIANYSFFTGNPLVGTYQRGLVPSEQAATNTSELAKAIAQFTSQTFGETFTFSPIKIDNFLQGYFGSVAGLVTMATDQAINPDRMDRPLGRYWMLSNFLYDPVGTRRIEEFYALREKVLPKLNTLRRLAEADPLRAEKFAQDNEQDLILAQGINTALRRLSDTRKYKQFLSSKAGAEDLTQEERSAELQAVRESEVEVVEWLRDARALVRNQ